MGVSAREFGSSHATDNRFKHRNLNSSKILYTQRGLFVKYDNPPFDNGALHAKLLDELINHVNLDFWVEIPEHVTLTKGRNDVIADHAPKVLDAMYEAFENLFLDVILANPKLLYGRNSHQFWESISSIFNEKYVSSAKSRISEKYPLKTKIRTQAAKIGSSALEKSGYVVEQCGEFLKFAGSEIGNGAKYILMSLPNELSAGVKSFRQKIPDFVDGMYKFLAKSRSLPKPRLPKLDYEQHNAGSSVQMPSLKSVFGSLKTGQQEPASSIDEKFDWSKITRPIGKFFSAVGNVLRDAPVTLVHNLGLYNNVEEKRERKRQKLREKISQKYLSSFKQDEFLKKIMNKRIIPATRYYGSSTARDFVVTEPKKTGEGFFAEVEKIISGDDLVQYSPTITDSHSTSKRFNLNSEEVKISIDELVDLHLKGHLKYERNQTWLLDIYNGDYLVDYKNPLVWRIVEKLEYLRYEADSKYDVKVLEDRLDFIGRTLQTTAAYAYLITPIGMAHMLASTFFKGIKSPVADRPKLQSALEKVKVAGKWCCEKDVGKPIIKTTVSGIKLAGQVASLPFVAAYHLLKIGYEHMFLPAVKAANPLKYPKYAKTITKWSAEKIKEVKESRALSQEEALKRKQLEKKSDKPTVVRKVLDFAKDAYHNSFLFEQFGYGESADTTFDFLNEKKLEYIIGVMDAGYSYINFMQAIKGIDALVSKALQSDAYEVVLSYKPASTCNQGFSLDKKKILHVNLNQAEVLMPSFSSIAGINQDFHESREFVSFTYDLLDLLLHVRAHEATTCADHFDYSVHHDPYDNIASIKAELRRKTVKYILENEQDLVSYVAQYFPSDKVSNVFYSLPSIKLSKLVNMTRKRLVDERIAYDKSQEERKKKIDDAMRTHL